MKAFLLFTFIISLCFSCSNRTEKKYPINENYYFKTLTSEYKGYTWTFFCNEETGSSVNFRGPDFYTGRIDKIEIKEVKNDTLVFTTFYKDFNNCHYKVDTLILSESRLISVSKQMTDCP